MADGVLAISETQSIVFRAPAPIAASAPTPITAPNPAMLFRYSALTFNSHRIHYDAPYARSAEGYPDLVVHGPLTATLLLDLVQQKLGLNAITRFHMRAISPAFVNQILHLVGREDGEGGWQLAAPGPDGRTIMTANAS